MYLRPAHTDLHTPTLYSFIRRHPLGIFTTAIKSPHHPLLLSSHIPWVLDVEIEDTSSRAPRAVLRGHIARANPQCKALIEAAMQQAGGNNTTLEEEVMVLFNSPLEHYVTPTFYVESKSRTGMVAPTWNYAAVQVYGRATVYFSSTPETENFLARQLDDLARQSEEIFFGHVGDQAWSVGEAPQSYVSRLKRGIAGIEIQMVRLAGKFKMSQEMGEGDRKGVVDGFEKLGTENGMAIAELVRKRGWKQEGEEERESI